MKLQRTPLSGAIFGAVLIAGAAMAPGHAHATPINGTVTLNDVGITLNNGTDLSDTTSLTVASFNLTAETGGITVPINTSETGTTFDLTNMASLNFPGVIDFTATGGHIVTQNATFLNIAYDGTVSVGSVNAPGTLDVTFTDNMGTLGGSNVAASFSAVPEPATLALLMTGLLGLGMMRRRDA